MEVKDTKKKDSEDVLSVGPDFSIQNLLLGPFQHLFLHVVMEVEKVSETEDTR